MCSKFNIDVYNYEQSWMERACQEKQVSGNLLGLCPYRHMDPRSDLGSESCSTWWLMPILLAAGTARSRSEETQSELKLSYNPWLFPTCLPKAIHTSCSRHGIAPHQHECQQSLFITCCDVSPAAVPAATAPLPPASALFIRASAFFLICLIQRMRPHKPPSSEGTIPPRNTLISDLQNTIHICQPHA